MAKQPTARNVTKKHLARLEKERIQRRYLITAAIVVAVLVVGVLIYGFLDQTVIQQARPIARVGSSIVTTGEFQSEVRFSRYRLISQLSQIVSDPSTAQFFSSYAQQIKSQLDSPTVLGQQVLDQMIEEQIIAQEAEKLGITVTEEELNRAVEETFGYFENGTPTPTNTVPVVNTSTLSPTQQALVPPTATPTETQPAEATATATEEPATATPAVTSTPTTAATATPDFTATPEPTVTPFTREGFQGLFDDYMTELENIDYSPEQIRALVKAQLLYDKIFAEITKDVQPEAEQVWARHILVATEEEAKAARERLVAGEDFATVASEISTDTSNKDRGGDLGWFGSGKMVAEFEEAAFALEIGEISQPVSTSFGFHIIQVLGHENRVLSASDYDQAKQAVFTEWIDAKKEELQVETFDDRWTEVVPTTPEIPLQVLSAIPEAPTSPDTLPIP